MKTYIFEGTVTALSSISHIGDSHGVNAKLRREKIVQSDGTVEEVPVISGNSIRGILRDRGMLHMLKALGYGVNEETGDVTGLSLAAFYFLFSGGALTKDAGRGIDVDEARKWRETIPLVALFGGAMGNQIMPGQVKVGKLIPICAETAHLVPERFVNGAGETSIWDLCQEEAYTRRDDEKNEKLRQLIAPDVRGLLEASAAAKREKARETPAGDVAGETGQKQQMRYYVETLAAGTQFFWDLTLDDVTDLEFDAFCVTLAEFSRFPYIGGKSGVGHGKIAVHFDHWTEIDPRLAPAGRALDFSLGDRYRRHLKERAGEIRELIDGLS
jgi:CRISPR type IV-associated protein Csf2